MSEGTDKVEIDRETLDTLAVVLAILLPPLGVLLKRGLSGQFLINIVLTLFGWLPGIIHALYIILKK
jgi:uncharacterized membrane protein YqaE (UPF0057 family)